jgi:hypothetical protein
MSIATAVVHDIRPVAEVAPVEGGLRITFRDGTTAFLDGSHSNFELLRIHAVSNQGGAVPVGVVLDADGGIVDLNTAHDASVQFVQEVPEDNNRLKVAFWGYSPVCYLSREHPEFDRLYSTLTAAAGTRTMLWVANYSEMVEDQPKTPDGEYEIWWKIMDVRPV